MEPKRYATAAAFRRALADRLQDIAGKEGVDLQRLRREVAFDRLLARLFQVGQPHALPWVLKGGYAMSCGSRLYWYRSHLLGAVVKISEAWPGHLPREQECYLRKMVVESETHTVHQSCRMR